MKAERRNISKRCMVQYIPGGIFRAFFKFCMGDKLREKMEGGKRDETFFSALIRAHSYKNLKIVGPLSKMQACTRKVPKIGKKH
jgi:hypothetical protein